MPKTPNLLVGVELTLDQKRAGEPEVIDEAWKDDLVQRMLRELKRQLCQLENSKPTPEIDQANIRIVNVRALVAMERTLDRLLRMDEQRELKCETTMAAKDDDTYAEIERRLDQRLAANGAQPIPEKPQQ